ncbi:MAG: PHP domain-containing protein [Candidatus Cloacimonadota bacterium]|nr:PHP domain-containing protein [Candidatus Cloacimonadota bacterium]
MKWYRADLHIHSVLSPCGSLEMSPRSVMRIAKEKKLDLIAITDHNSMANCMQYAQVAAEFGIDFLYGVEVQTAEEIHLVALFDNLHLALEFDKDLYKSLLLVDNDPDYFGDQVVVDSEENIVRFEKRALINSSCWNFDEALNRVNEASGFAFPAHVDAATYSVIAQLGFIPENSNISAVGISAKANINEVLEKFPQLKKYSLIQNSDAHYLKDIGSGFTYFYLEETNVNELKLACENKKGRKIKNRYRRTNV